MTSQPLNTSLYEKVKAEAKKKFKVWPSAYASAWLVKEYKRRGGKYKGKRDSQSGLSRWFAEEWIDVCHLPKKVACGRPKGGYSADKYSRKYPYCRPLNRINNKTPRTARELSATALKRRCSKKRATPRKRLTSNK